MGGVLPLKDGTHHKSGYADYRRAHLKGGTFFFRGTHNPVKHGLVDTPSDWRYSSFAEFVKKGKYGIEWGQFVPDQIAEMNLE